MLPDLLWSSESAHSYSDQRKLAESERRQRVLSDAVITFFTYIKWHAYGAPGRPAPGQAPGRSAGSPGGALDRRGFPP